MEQIENRMLRERMTEGRHDDEMAKMNSLGWVNITDGTFVPEELAFDYAIDHCTNFVPEGFHKIQWTQEFKDAVVERFYSDNWVHEDG